MTDTTDTDYVRHRTTPTSDQAIRDAVYRHTPAGTAEVADVIGMSRQAADYRLKKLEREGYIWSKKVGPTNVLKASLYRRSSRTTSRSGS